MIERARHVSIGLAVLGLGMVIAIALFRTPERSQVLVRLVVEELPHSGVTNPVTAVLLNFRAFDTLLEIAVLLLTLVAVWALGIRLPDEETIPPSSVFNVLLSVTVPLLTLISGYLLWVGATAPGGAFQAGAVLAGGCLLLRLAGVLKPNPSTLRSLATVGLSIFLIVAIATLASTGGLLQFPMASAGTWILVTEAAATISIAAILTALFIAQEPSAKDQS